MRALEEIIQEINRAVDLSDLASMQRHVVELEAHESPDAGIALTRLRGSISFILGDYHAAMTSWLDAMRSYEARSDRSTVAVLLGGLGSACLLLGDYTTALEYAQRSLAVSVEIADLRLQSGAHIGIGNVLNDTGRPEEALVSYQKALELSERMGDLPNAALVSGNISNAYYYVGDYPRAIEYQHRALERYRELGAVDGLVRTLGNLGVQLDTVGDHLTALEHLHQALDIVTEHDRRPGMAHILTNLAYVYQNCGDYDRALAHLHQAREIQESLQRKPKLALILGNIGSNYGQLGDVEHALEYHLQALDLFRELGEQSSVVHFMGNVIGNLITLERFDEARAMLEQQAEMVMDSPLVRAIHFSNRADIAIQEGDLIEARQLLTQALSIVTQAGVRNYEAFYHEDLRDLAQKLNDFPAYIEHNTAFQQITEELQGQEITRKLTNLEAQRKIAAERAEKDKHKALLYNTLPPAIADRVLRGETVNDSHDLAAVMFMDMAGFTTMSSAMDANDVVQLLSEIFTTCDAIMAEHGMMKIKTIGDSYMAVAIESNTEDRRPKTSEVVNNAANAAVQVLTTLTEQHPQIKVRIGLHCGPVTAGVIGTERLQYDVWGDTVNVASRMESHGEPGRIHVSEAFTNALTPCLPDSLTLLKRGIVEIKGKGPMTTYWLERAQ